MVLIITYRSKQAEPLKCSGADNFRCNLQRISLLFPAFRNMEKFPGEVSEWLKEHAWKVCIR